LNLFQATALENAHLNLHKQSLLKWHVISSSDHAIVLIFWQNAKLQHDKLTAWNSVYTESLSTFFDELGCLTCSHSELVLKFESYSQ
jgi:hypothetical protein